MFIDRLLDVAGTRRDFSMLDPEQYLTAALTAPKEALAAVFVTSVFDPGEVQLDADVLVTAVETFRPRKPYRRPPRPPALPPGPDPIALAKERAEQVKRRRTLTAEQQLQGADEVDLTGLIRSGRWPHGARVAVDALQVSLDADLPYMTELSEALLVDPEGPVAHLSPMSLRRTSARAQPPIVHVENVPGFADASAEAGVSADG